MSFCTRRFNLYLSLLLGTLVLTAAGCKTNKPEDQVASLRIYVENRAQVTGGGQTVSVLRSSPVLVTIDPDPALTEANIIAAALLKTPDQGYAIEVRFDESGTLMLEQYSAANVGRHFAIFSQWSENTQDSRWLAAPIISHRIPNGVLSFTPDASLDEAKKIVLGLNNMAKKMAKRH